MIQQDVKLDPIKINPVEELLQAIEIVHGPNTAWAYRRFVWEFVDAKIAKSENCGGAGI